MEGHGRARTGGRSRHRLSSPFTGIAGRSRAAYGEWDLRRGSFLLLVSSCATGLFIGSSYLGESSATASNGQGGTFDSQVERMIEARQTLSEALMERGREIAYGLERAKDELEDLIP